MNLQNSRLLLFVGAGLAAVLLLQVIQIQKSSILAKRIDALEQGHRALQDSFLDGSRTSRARLAASLGYRATRSLASVGGPAQEGRDEGAPPPSSGQTYAAMRQAIARETRDAAWAGNVQLNVRDVAQGLSREGFSIPATPTVDCRSRHCLIDFDLGESGDPDEWIQQFLTEIAGDLPQTRYVQVLSPDGRISLKILADRGTGR
jgi:hypothetical protein